MFEYGNAFDFGVSDFEQRKLFCKKADFVKCYYVDKM